MLYFFGFAPWKVSKLIYLQHYTFNVPNFNLIGRVHSNSEHICCDRQKDTRTKNLTQVTICGPTDMSLVLSLGSTKR